MSKKSRNIFVCTNCGNEFPRWSGQCSVCKEWNVLEESELLAESEEISSKGRELVSRKLSEINVSQLKRFGSGFSEVDRVLGGEGVDSGFVDAEVVLLSGEPGVGKSTLLLQIVSNLSRSGKKCAYVSAEESASQIALRAERLFGQKNIEHDFDVVSGGEVEGIIDSLRLNGAEFVVVDSIQTVYSTDARGIAGGVSQVKASSMKLVNYAKDNNVTLVIVGHINKEGSIAGPKVLEHLVDAVLQIEGEQKAGFRIVRTLKNRFGGTNEVGILSMGRLGLEDIADASLYFVSEESAPGVCRSAIVDGNRVIIIQVQALVNTTSFSQPKRVAQGIPISKLQVVCAVLQKHSSLNLSDKDVYVNIAGGLKVNDPGVDLAIALAIASSLKVKSLSVKFAAIGELSLTGSIGRSFQHEKRKKELEAQGYKLVDATRVGDIAKIISSI